MQKIFGWMLVVSPIIFSSQLLGFVSPTVAQENNDLYSSLDQADDLLSRSADGKVTSVSELSDVQPTDWAFQALQSLVERYGCIAGYPDRTFKGNRALTRYEFAAGLNACMDKVGELITANTTNGIQKNDLVTLKKLQEQFASELATLRGRVDALETRTAQLQAQQFSPTTKLSGFVAFNFTGATASSSVRRETGSRIAGLPQVQRVNDPSVTESGLVWLTLYSSFTGKDSLVTQLAVGNGNSPVNQFASAGQFNTTGVPYFDQTSGVDTNQFTLRTLAYTFPVSKTVSVTVGPRINWYANFDDNAFTSPFTGAGSFNSINSTFLASTKRGAGAIFLWNPTEKVQVHAGYLAESLEFNSTNAASDPSKGLFNGTNTLTAELTFKPTDKSNLRFLYQRSNLNRNSAGQIDVQPIVGVADDGFGGRVRDANSDTYAFNFDWLVNRNFGLFGRYAYSSTAIRPVVSTLSKGDINAQTFQAGLAFPNLGKTGSLATISLVMPFDILDGRKFLAAGAGNGGTQYDLEASYYYPVTDHISVVPAFYYIRNINNFSNNPDVYVGHFRTQFTF